MIMTMMRDDKGADNNNNGDGVANDKGGGDKETDNEDYDDGQ
jgi:hypothetical protein